MSDYIGQRFGHYTLTHLIGRGGMANVYLGQHVQIEQLKAAVKIVREYTPNTTSARDFLREARMLARLDHPHITRLLEFDISDHTPYIVMTYAPYGNMAQKHPLGEKVPLSTVLLYLQQIGPALQYAHQKQIIHCDLKPNNLLIDENERILVADFGFAHLLQTTSRSQTSHQLGATVAYCAPEQFNQKPCKASDQYALGIILYQWICGQLPFSGTDPQLMAQHLRKPVPPLKKLVPDLPQAIEDVLLQALAKEPQQRFATVKQFVDAFTAAVPVETARYTIQPSENIQDETEERSTESRATSRAYPPLKKRWQPSQSFPTADPVGPRALIAPITTLLAGLVLAAGLVWLTLFLYHDFTTHQATFQRYTGQANGIVVVSTKISNEDTGDTTGSCTSAVNFSLHRKTWTIPNDGCSADPQTPVAVLYNPHNPQDAQVAETAQDDIFGAGALLFGGPLFYIILAGWGLTKLYGLLAKI